MLIKPQPSVADLTIADIRDLSTQRATSEADALRARQDAARDRDRAREQHRRDVQAALAELAADLGTSSPGVLGALTARAPVRHGPTADRTLGPLWRALFKLTGGVADDVDLQATAEARHVLTATGALPGVRKSSVFGDVKRVRELPNVPLRSPKVYEQVLLEDLARDLGEAYPQVARVDIESPRDAWERTRDLKSRHTYDADPDRNAKLADRDYQLTADAHAAATAKARAAFEAEAIELRRRLVAAIDALLAIMPLGVPWAWARELRRHVAGERPHLETEFARVWSTCQALGVRLELAGGRS